MQSQSKWYQAQDNDLSLDPADEAFRDGVKILGSNLAKDGEASDAAWYENCIQDVQDVVLDAQSRYNQSHQGKKVGKWLAKFSSRVRYYGNILDVLVQHHPEYVSLAWGAMKILFVLVVNHETMIRTLAKSLCQIADSLPRMEFATVLYPTKRMKQAVAELYAHIIRFLTRAQCWYKESTFKHIVHSFTRPAELEYADIIEEIEACTRSVDSIASAAAHAEQRDIHLQVQELLKRQKESDAVLLNMRSSMMAYQSINSSSLLDTGQKLSDLQLSHVMDFTSSACRTDALKSLQYCAFMRNKHLTRLRAPMQPFWLGPKFQTWKSLPASSLIVVKGNYSSRFEVKDFCVNAIDLLRESRAPVIWALKSIDNETEAPSVVDLLKHLTSQALRLNIAIHNERSLALSCTKFRGAETEDEWLDVLGSVLAGIPQIYIILDMEAVSFRYRSFQGGFSWPKGFLALFQKMSQHDLKSAVKVILVSYGSPMPQGSCSTDIRSSVISVKTSSPVAAVTRGKLSKMPRGCLSSGRGQSRGRRRGLAFESLA